MFLRALRVCSDDFLTEEINFITNSLKQLAYPDKILKNALTKAKRTFFRSKTQVNVNSDIIPVSRPSHKLVLPFVKSIQQYKTHLKHFNTDLIFTYKNKLKTQLSHNKPPSLIKSGVYSIPCNDCNKSYIGETGRDLKIRIKEHKKRHFGNEANKWHSPTCT